MNFFQYLNTTRVSSATAAAAVSAALGLSAAAARYAHSRSTKAHAEALGAVIDPTTGEPLTAPTVTDLDSTKYERIATEGCSPDNSYYVDHMLTVHNVDGSHQGMFVALLREHLMARGGHEDQDPTTPRDTATIVGFDEEFDTATGPRITGLDEPLILAYEDALRGGVEVLFNLAMNLSEASMEEQGCSCGEEDCEASIDIALQHLVAGQYLLQIAKEYERQGTIHAAQCEECVQAGPDAPTFMRARLCRDMADDIFLNDDNDNISLRGVPVEAVLDVAVCLMDNTDRQFQISIDAQIDRLTDGTVWAISHTEGHAQTSN